MAKNREKTPYFLVYKNLGGILIFVIKGMNRIKEVLTEKGIKQKWLAEQLGKSYNVVNSYVQNRQQPRLEVLFAIAKILEVNPKDLIKNTNE